MSKLKYFDKWYAGIKHTEAKDNASGLPLGFIVPDGDDSGAKKRKETVDNWVNGYGYMPNPASSLNECKVVDNTPMNGFKIVDWAGRYSTDNKVVRVVDPRGYELEVYIPNLLELIQTCDINKGEINAELLWLRDGAANKLVRADNPVIKEAKAPPAKRKKLRHEVGDIIKQGYYNYLYLGIHDTEFLYPVGERVIDKARTKQQNHRHWMFPKPDEEITLYKLIPNAVGSHPVGRKHVYLRVDVNDDTVTHDDRLELRASQMTTYKIISSNNDLPKYSETTVWPIDAQFWYDPSGNVLDIDDYVESRYDSDAIQICNVRITDGKFTKPIKLNQLRTSLYSNHRY